MEGNIDYYKSAARPIEPYLIALVSTIGDVYMWTWNGRKYIGKWKDTDTRDLKRQNDILEASLSVTATNRRSSIINGESSDQTQSEIVS